MLSSNSSNWGDLREDFQVCFGRASDLIGTQAGAMAIHRISVLRLAEKSVLKICKNMIEGSLSAEEVTPTGDDHGTL
jgi:hypothetical protein